VSSILNINDLKNSGNDRNEIEVSVKIPVPARFHASDRKEFLRNFEPSSCQRCASGHHNTSTVAIQPLLIFMSAKITHVLPPTLPPIIDCVLPTEQPPPLRQGHHLLLRKCVTSNSQVLETARAIAINPMTAATGILVFLNTSDHLKFIERITAEMVER
jgi:hypothetical protein